MYNFEDIKEFIDLMMQLQGESENKETENIDKENKDLPNTDQDLIEKLKKENEELKEKVKLLNQQSEANYEKYVLTMKKLNKIKVILEMM